MIFFPRWWKYNTPDNESALKGALSDLHDLPKNNLKPYMVKAAKHLPEKLREAYLLHINTVYDTVSDTVYDTVSPQEQEQKQEQEQEQNAEKIVDHADIVFPTDDQRLTTENLAFLWTSHVKGRSPEKLKIVKEGINELISSGVSREVIHEEIKRGPSTTPARSRMEWLKDFADRLKKQSGKSQPKPFITAEFLRRAGGEA